MRYIKYISVAVLTFAFGFSLSSILRTSAPTNIEMQSVAELRNDDLHRLFEAAQMSKDEQLREGVLGRLQCAGEDGSLGRRLLQTRGSSAVFCGEFNYEQVVTNVISPGFISYFDIVKTHSDWSRNNMAFISSVADPKTARLYIKNRLARE